MTQTGIVDRIPAPGRFCFLKTQDGTDVFAHAKFFPQKRDMQIGQLVRFTLAPAPLPGRSPEATNIELIAA